MSRFWFSRVSSLVALLTLSVSSMTRCQAPPPIRPSNEVGVWSGYSFGNPHVIGTTSNRRLIVLGLRYGRTLFDRGSVSLEYMLDIMPIEIVRQPTFVTCNPQSVTGAFCREGQESVYGGGVNPLGLKSTFLRRHQLQVFVASTAGLVASVRPIPVDIPLGTRLNFTFDFQAGLQRSNSSRARAWMLGYKYQHISNGNRSNLNPGVDVNVIFAGYSFFK